ncbi:MAG: PIG-L family deacetylase, partial [Thermoanaerobaculia bacterium]|nr:PIG-L family deacetylase [Thermoanaerobaculia bacterium]
MRTTTRFITLILLLVTVPVFAHRVRPVGPMNAAETKLALDRLDVLASALYVAAHPDDENTAMLAWLANGRLAETTYLSLTRGSGGQNLIGPETGDLLGVIRTEELLAAREIDAAEQRFTRGIDFGYTKSPEETLTIWNEEAVLGDVVRVIRERRPDVIVTRFPTDGRGGHGQHTASAILALRAFELAGDPTAYPDQLDVLDAWQPRRIFWNFWGEPDPERSVVTVDLGEYNELLGTSYAEISALSRSMHKSQGFGMSARRGSVENHFVLIGGDEPESNDLFDGIDTTWNRVDGAGFVAALIDNARENYDADQPDSILPVLLELWDQFSTLEGADDSWWIDLKKDELQRIIASVSGLWIEAIADHPTAAPGSTLPVEVMVLRRAGTSGALVAVDSPWTDEVTAVEPLIENAPVTTALEIPVPEDVEPTQPYWLEVDNDGSMHLLNDPGLATMPTGPSSIPVEVRISIDGRDMRWTIPVLYRWTDRVRGELYRELEIVPPVTMSIDPPLLTFPDHEPRTAKLTIDAAEDVSGTVRFDVSEGWNVAPPRRSVELEAGSIEIL